MGGRSHWDHAYADRVDDVSWHQDQASTSLDLIAGLELPGDSAIIDIGGGASTLVDGLIERGYTSLAVLDLSPVALQAARQRLDRRADRVDWIAADLLAWEPAKRYRVWHDRAVLHFLTDPPDIAGYFDTMRSVIEIGGFVIIGVFALDGPEQCSGLPVRRYSIADLEHELGDGFTTLAGLREDHTTPSGCIQHFNWMVARRDS